MIGFRKISSPEAFQKLLTFLKDDVAKNSGSATEVIEMHGVFREITISSSSWGPIVINKEVSKLEAWASWLNVSLIAQIKNLPIVQQ